jgi:hypothetical protein
MSSAPLEALLAGDREMHDHLFLETCDRFRATGVECLSRRKSLPGCSHRARTAGIPVLESSVDESRRVAQLRGTALNPTMPTAGNRTPSYATRRRRGA